jgi:hypothetical protein
VAHQTIAIAGETHQRECIRDALLPLGSRNEVETCGEKQVLIARELAVGRKKLWHVADAAADPCGLCCKIEAGDGRAAGGRRQHRGEHLDEGALAGAIGSNQAEDLRSLHSKRHRIHGGEISEPSCQLECLDDRLAIHDVRTSTSLGA